MRKMLSLSLAVLFALSLSALSLAAPYGDVPPDEWYAEAVDYCTANALMLGTGDGCFEPDAPVTRAMATTVLHRLAGSPEPQARGVFADVPQDEWYAEAADWAAEAGVAEGTGKGFFSPADVLSRQDFAALLWRMAASPETAEPSPFPDEATVSGYALGAVRWAAELGLVNGMDDGRFAPQSAVTRAQLATILMRLDGGALLQSSTVSALHAPRGIAEGRDGALLVADSRDKRVYEVKGGVITVYAGAETALDELGAPRGGYRDGARLNSLFAEPWGIAPFLDGWAVSDARSGSLRLITGNQVLTINGTPDAAESAAAAGIVYDMPTGLAADEQGRLYVAETGSGTIRRITPEGRVSLFAQGLNEPTGVCWYDGALYVAETGENRVLRVTESGATVFAGSGAEGFDDGAASRASFRSPVALAAGADGTIYVADMVNGAVRAISGGQVRTLLRPDGGAASSVSPTGLLVRDGVLWVCDGYTGSLTPISLD